MKKITNNTILNLEIKNDIIKLLKTVKTKNCYYYINSKKFYRLFLKAYPLKYQRDDFFIISEVDLIIIIKELNIASKFKFKKKNPKRIKFIIKKIHGKDNE